MTAALVAATSASVARTAAWAAWVRIAASCTLTLVKACAAAVSFAASKPDCKLAVAVAAYAPRTRPSNTAASPEAAREIVSKFSEAESIAAPIKLVPLVTLALVPANWIMLLLAMASFWLNVAVVLLNSSSMAAEES